MSAGTSVQRTPPGATKRWIAIAAAIAAVVVAVAAVLHFMGSPKLIKGEKLVSLLLNDEQLSTVMGAAMVSGKVSTEGTPTAGGLSKTQCLSALNAAQTLSYTDSGYTDVRWSDARDNPENVEHYAVQAVATFPDAARAESFVANEAAEWRLCADEVVVTVAPQQDAVNWRMAGVIGTPPKVSISATREDVKWTCQRALRAAANVVVDVTACSQQITDQGRRLGDQIAGRVAK